MLISPSAVHTPNVKLDTTHIISCSSSPERSSSHTCTEAYDGTLSNEFMVLMMGDGYTASTGWLQINLDGYYVIEGVKLMNRCRHIEDQASNGLLSLGNPISVTEVKRIGSSSVEINSCRFHHSIFHKSRLHLFQISYPCYNNCGLVDWHTVLTKLSISSYVKVDLTRKCVFTQGKVGVREMEILIVDWKEAFDGNRSIVNIYIKIYQCHLTTSHQWHKIEYISHRLVYISLI